MAPSAISIAPTATTWRRRISTQAAGANSAWRMMCSKPTFVSTFNRSRMQHVSFAWQGGEPTLLGIPFFERVVELQKKHANGKTIDNAFQTNGTLLDDAWGEFLARNKFLIGLVRRWAGGDSRCVPRGQGRQADIRARDARPRHSQEAWRGVQHAHRHQSLELLSRA
jgi:hypothetical protein